MPYSPTQAGQQLAASALTKLIVYFKDGNARTFYGRHNLQGRTVSNPQDLEIQRLLAYAGRVQAHIQMAILYDTQTGDELARFKNRAWV